MQHCVWISFYIENGIWFVFMYTAYRFALVGREICVFVSEIVCVIVCVCVCVRMFYIYWKTKKKYKYNSKTNNYYVE